MKKDWLWILLLVPMMIIICVMEYTEFLVRYQFLGRWYIWLYTIYVAALSIFGFWWWNEYRKHKDDD